MSHQPGPNRPAAIRSTKQQLAELDALLERMLALPVHHLSDKELSARPAAPPPPPEPAPPAADVEHADEPPPTPSLTFLPIASPGQAEALASAPEYVEVAAGDATPASLQQALEDWQFPSPAAAAFRDIPTTAATTDDAETPGPSTMPAADSQADEPTPWPARPALWCNQAFDAVAGCLGAPGRWLQGNAGRTLLGVTGLLLLAAAAAWAVLDWVGLSW